MKQILFFALIWIAITVDEDDLRGPAYNYKHQNSIESCTNNTFDNVNGVSNCVDRLLWDKENDIYYDHCCYIRYQKEGEMHAACIGLSEENFLDTTITMKRIETGDRSLINPYDTSDSKIYQLDCFSSYLKSISITSLLLALFF